MLNQDWFAEEFRRAGHEVITAGLAEHLDDVLHAPLTHVDSLIARVFKGHLPDRIVVHDNSAPIILQGLDETDIPTIFYSVDTHHHVLLHRYLAQMFDVTLVAQRDYIPEFSKFGYTPEWFPLWASRYFEPSASKTYGAVFVGALNPALNPERVAFFNALREKIPVYATTGNFWEIFPQAEIVINQTVRGDLNFRVFEALMSGSLLLTESSPNGLSDLFVPGEHLITYTKNDVNEAAEIITRLLKDPAYCRRIGAQGRAEVLAKHTTAARAERMLEVIQGAQKRAVTYRYLASMANFSSYACKVQRIDTSSAVCAAIASMKAAEQALKFGEMLDMDLACYLLLACAIYERYIGTGTSETLLFEAYERQPSLEPLAVGKLRALLHRGEIAEAENFAKRISCIPHRELFAKSELFIEELCRTAQLAF
jgi:hypothetical protein